MATRRPIVMVAGRLKELPVGDTVEGTTASGSVDSVTSTVPQVSHGFAVGTPIKVTSAGWIASRANSDATVCDAMVSAVADANNFTVTEIGQVTLTTAEWDARTGDTGGLTKGEYYWLSTAAGCITKTQPTSGFAQCLGVAESATVLRFAKGPVVSLSGSLATPDYVGGNKYVSGTSIEVSDLNLAAHQTYVIDYSIKLSAAGSLYIFFNGDTTATNYRKQHWYGNSTSLGGVRGSDSLISFDNVAGSISGTIVVNIDADGLARAQNFSGTGTASIDVFQSVVAWLTASNVTSIALSCSTMTTGSYMRIFRRTGAPL